jgi:C1A family cysteine protease
MAPIDLATITDALAEQKADWTAAHTPLLELPEDELKRRLGVVVDEPRLKELVEQPDPDIAELIARIEHARQASSASASEHPTPEAVELVRARLSAPPRPHPSFFWWQWSAVDWRNNRGRNNVTPIKDQGNCGSCVAFGTVAALESMVLVEHNVPLDLSEAELLFCGGGSCGGWWPDSAIAYVKSHGVALESCFPYQPKDMPCSTCSERDGEAIQALGSVVINDVAQREQYLREVGPMIAVFAVYEDFYAYRSGIYSHVHGNLVGYHCVEVIGFVDFPFFKFWICKNSWGTGWGESGFFCIGYGQCGIDSQFPFWGIHTTKWFRP